MKIEEEINQSKFNSAQEKAIVNIIFTANAIEDAFKNALKVYGISLPQYNVLRILKGRKHGHATCGDLKDVMLDKNPDIKADLIDLRTLLPYDKEAIINSVAKTGKAIVLHEDTLFGGFGGELAAVISEQCFEKLDAPVMRCGSLDTPVPMNADLEINFLAKSRFEKQLLNLWKY